jgi:hypothetical protein
MMLSMSQTQPCPNSRVPELGYIVQSETLRGQVSSISGSLYFWNQASQLLQHLRGANSESSRGILVTKTFLVMCCRWYNREIGVDDASLRSPTDSSPYEFPLEIVSKDAMFRGNMEMELYQLIVGDIGSETRSVRSHCNMQSCRKVFKHCTTKWRI